MSKFEFPDRIFRAYDIRGKYPEEVNERVAAEVACALGGYFKRGAIVVGRDARLSSPSLYRAALRGLARAGRRNIIRAGLITTPMLSFLAIRLKAAGGLIITASHNPKEYNGIKAVREKGEFISGKEIYKLLISN